MYIFIYIYIYIIYNGSCNIVKLIDLQVDVAKNLIFFIFKYYEYTHFTDIIVSHAADKKVLSVQYILGRVRVRVRVTGKHVAPGVISHFGQRMLETSADASASASAPPPASPPSSSSVVNIF